MSLILAIDPGPEKSGWLLWSTERQRPQAAGIQPNIEVAELINVQNHVEGFFDAKVELVIEMVQSYGMAVGKDVFETVFWIGRFCQLAGEDNFHRVYRRDIKLHFCKSARAKDANIRQALIDLFGGKDKAIGGKKCEKCHGKAWTGRKHFPCTECEATGWKYPPGPFHGIKSHLWSALALAIYYQNTLTPTPRAPESV